MSAAGLEIDKHRGIHRLVFWLSCFLLTGLVLYIFLQDPGCFTCTRRAMFSEMVYGRAYRPFVYRILLPGATRLLTAALPGGLRAWLNGTVGGHPLMVKAFAKMRWEREFFTEYAIGLGLMYLSLWGFVFSLRYLFRGLMRAPGRMLNLATLGALAALPPFFRNCSYVYDFSTLFLFTLGLGLMARRRWRPFLLVYLLGCLNKETTILLTLIFVIHFWPAGRMERRTLGRLVAGQVLIFLAVKLALFFAFQSNRGAFLEFHLLHPNLRELLVRKYSIEGLFTFFAIVLLVFRRWSEKPALLRDGLWIVLPLFLLTLFLGYLDEWRDYYEAYPLVVLLASYTVGEILGLKVDTVEGKP